MDDTSPNDHGVPPSRVLVCDDDEHIRTVIRTAIEPLGHTVIDAEDAKIAVTLCDKELPDLIIMDVMLPQVSGLEFVKWFRKTYPETYVPIMMVSARSEVETRVEGLKMGADDYLPKPFHHRELRARVTALLRTKQLNQRLTEQTEELKKVQAALNAKKHAAAGDQITGAAAHEIKQPVTTILLHCHLIRQYIEQKATLEDAAGDIASSLAIIQNECDTMNKLVERLAQSDPNEAASYVGGLELVASGDDVENDGK